MLHHSLEQGPLSVFSATPVGEQIAGSQERAHSEAAEEDTEATRRRSTAQLHR